VSFWLGAGDPLLARRACRKGFTLMIGMALLLGVLMVLLRGWLSGVYSGDAEVAALAGVLLCAAAAYHTADAVQTMCVYVLRCYRVTVAPLLIYCALLWGGGLGGSYLLAFRGLGPWPAMQSPLAYWLMSATALWVTALLFVALLWRAIKPPRRVQPAPG
jgi:MATE family multidrug resistance protein